ncbi:MAG: glycosyl hydrolase [Bacteroidetes bacterium HGW-Bacteroidetes-4]|jgi:beta-glucosidase|nr:MAG: glycosyl hydrolase [Bacteroidetes bacterium HGW-Bacteroidetes-4]
MKIKFTYLIIFLGALLLQACNRTQTKLQTDSEWQSKIDSLLELMTIDEKIGQLNLLTSGWDVTGPNMSENYQQLIKEGKVGGIFNAFTVKYISELQRLAVEETRLGIPLLFGYDVIHGHRTIFPIPLAQSCSWDLALIEQSEQVAAREASAEGINWTFAPMVDISRDPRWGRVSEGAGEDTWLGSQIGAVRVRGFQGTDLSANNTLISCVKHFAAYGAPQAGRDYHTVDMSERSLREWYLPPYKAAIDAGAVSVMTSFNEINGVPATSNHWLYTDLLRGEWGFEGFTVTDYSSIYELIPHGVAADSAMAGELALKAGIDMDMQATVYQNHLKQSVEKGTVTMQKIDAAVSRIIKAKYRLGLFDDPYKYCNLEREKTEILTPESQALARDFVSKSCVLLKNDRQTLPIPKTVKKIALIGPLGNSKVDMLGNWSAAGRAEDCVTLYEGLQEKSLSYHFSLSYEKGCDVLDASTAGFAKAIQAAKNADYIVLALGEHGNMSGEAASRTDIGLPEVQQKLADAIIALKKPVVVVLFNGRPLTLNELDATAPAILEAWFGGTQAGNGIADLLFADAIPSGKLTMTFPHSVGQIPIHYNMKNTGRPVTPDNPDYKYKSRYIDSPNEALYPFGYGLSYTTFEYKDLMLNAKNISAADTLQITVEVSNTGNFDAHEVVQLYIRDVVGSVTRPVKELKGFEKVYIPKNESVKVNFKISANDLRFYNLKMDYTFEPGFFKVFVGPNSAEGLSESFELR